MKQNFYERERSERFVFIFVGALDFKFCFPESNPISVSICRALLGIMTGTAQLEVNFTSHSLLSLFVFILYYSTKTKH